MKRLALAFALISAALLSGCIVVPAHRYHGGGYYRGGYQGGGYGPYQDGHGYSQPGPR